MYAFAIRGELADALDRLLATLEDRVALVRTAMADGATTTREPTTEYVLDAEGWQASSKDRSLPDVLDRLAPDHEFAVVVGDAPLPTVVVEADVEAVDPSEATFNGVSGDGTVIYAAPPQEFDPNAAIDAVTRTEPHETLDSLVAKVKAADNSDRAGAIATFTGRVRAKDSIDDNRTHYLEFEKYEGVADRTLRTIESELEAREGIFEVKLHHRVGQIPDGEDIVFVVVLAGHRREAFRTVEDGIDRLKDEVPLFKKEVTDSDTFWVHEREE